MTPVTPVWYWKQLVWQATESSLQLYWVTLIFHWLLVVSPTVKARVAVSVAVQLRSRYEWYPVLVPHRYGYGPYVVEVWAIVWAVVVIVMTSVRHCPWVACTVEGAVKTNKS